jgi:hypothetical protein
MPSKNNKAIFHTIGIRGILIFIILFFIIFVDF